MWVKLTGMFAVLWLLPTAAAWAAEEPLRLPDAQPAPNTSFDFGSMLLKTGLALAFTIMLVWVLARLVRRIGRAAPQSGNGPAVQVLSRTVVDKDLTVYVLQLADQISVVGRSPGGSVLLRRMSAEEAEELGLLSSVNASDQRLRSVMGELRSRLRPGALPAASVDDLLERQ